MNKKTIWGITAIFVVIFGVGLVTAIGPGYGERTANPDFEPGVFHEQMENIMETGTYADLEALREETGMPVMPRVQSQEDFDAQQLRHAEMEQYWEEQGIEPGQRGHRMHLYAKGFESGFGGGFRQGAHEGCPMAD